MTLRELALEWARDGRMKLSTRRRVDSAVRLYLTSSTPLAAMDVGAITRRDCERWFAAIAAPGAANRTLDILRRVLSEAVARGMRPDNPAVGMRTHPRRLVTRFLSRPELRRVQRALDAAISRSRGAAEAQVDAIRMLLYTGARCGEIIGLRWAEVRPRTIHLQDSKTGPRVVPLSAPARDILARRHARRRHEVFVFEREWRRPISAELSVWRRVRRDADVADVRLHDLRHTFASHAVMRGVPLPVVQRLLGHASIRMTMRYAHVGDAETRRAAERIGGRMAALLDAPEEQD